MTDILGLPPETVVFIGQALGIIGTVLAMISFQCKKLPVFCTYQSLSGLAFTLHFIFLGDPVSAVLNSFNIIRGIAFGFGPDKYRKFFLVSICVLYVGSALITFDPAIKPLWMTLLIMFAQVAGTTIVYIGNAKIIRFVQLGYISPAWMINNVAGGSIGGILCETFNIISNIVALIRFRKEWFGKKKEPASETE